MDKDKYYKAFKRMQPGDIHDLTKMNDPATFREKAKEFMRSHVDPNLTFNDDYTILKCIVTIIEKVKI